MVQFPPGSPRAKSALASSRLSVISVEKASMEQSIRFKVAAALTPHVTILERMCLASKQTWFRQYLERLPGKHQVRSSGDLAIER